MPTVMGLVPTGRFGMSHLPACSLEGWTMPRSLFESISHIICALVAGGKTAFEREPQGKSPIDPFTCATNSTKVAVSEPKPLSAILLQHPDLSEDEQLNNMNYDLRRPFAEGPPGQKTRVVGLLRRNAHGLGKVS